MPLTEFFLLTWLAGLAAVVIRHDLADLEIPERPVLGLAGLAILSGILFPATGQPDDALAGAAMALALGTLTRAYIHWRTGVAAFGGADIALLAGGGGLLGPELLGPWVLLSALIAIAGATLLPQIGFRKADLEGDDLQVLPFCPALIVGASTLYIATRAGWISAQGLF